MLKMRKTAGMVMLLSLLSATAGCVPESVEYPHLSQVMSDMTKKGPLPFSAVSVGMTMQGSGYIVKSEVCPGSYTLKSAPPFHFGATLDDGKWVVVAERDVMDSVAKDEAVGVFSAAIEQLIEQCEDERKRKASWLD